MKRTIRLNEADLHRIVKESVNRILNEAYGGFQPYYDEDNWNFGVNVTKNTTENNIYGKTIKLPPSSVPGIDDEEQLEFKVVAVDNLGDRGFLVAVQPIRKRQWDEPIVGADLTKKFGDRPCYASAKGKTVGIALNKAIALSVAKIQNSVKHPYKPETPWEWRIP